MANKRRGEVTFEVEGPDGNQVEYTMCMTLGAMAEIEEAFDLDDISQLSSIFDTGKFKIAQLISLLGALIRGGGHDIDDEEIKLFDLDAVEAFGKAMEAINVQGEGKTTPPKKRAAKRKPTKR